MSEPTYRIQIAHERPRVTEGSATLSRMMIDGALLSVSLAGMRLFTSRPDAMNAGMLLFVLFLAFALDRAVFAPKRRPFWVGFLVGGWLFLAVAVPYHWVWWNYFLERNYAWIQTGAAKRRPLTRDELQLALLLDSAIRLAIGLGCGLLGGALGLLPKSISDLFTRRSDETTKS